MALSGLPRERALATLTYLLETTLIRIGNSAYARENDSYGLSTLTPEHSSSREQADVRVHRQERQEVAGDDPRPPRRRGDARLPGMPGQQLFRYVDEAGEAHGVSSADVNAYLKSASGRRISAKDFRTWGGTLLCALALAAEPPAESERARKRQIAAAMRETAKALGNTQPSVGRATCIRAC